MKKIKSSNAPSAIGPYSQAIVSNGLVLLLDKLVLIQIQINLNLEILRAKRFKVFENISAILIGSGSSMNRIVKINIFLTDLSNFDKLNDIMDNIFDNDNLPSRSTIEVSALPKGAAIEVDVIAELVK